MILAGRKLGGCEKHSKPIFYDSALINVAFIPAHMQQDRTTPVNHIQHMNGNLGSYQTTCFLRYVRVGFGLGK